MRRDLVASARAIRPGKLGNQVADALRREILEGRLKPGDHLPREDELITTFGISRPTLREGIRILESLQLIRIYRGKKGGAEVTLPTKAATAASAANYLQSQKATLRDLIEARIALEPTLLLALDGQVTESTVDALRQIILTCERSDRSPTNVAQMLSAFRRALFDCMRNPVLNLIAGVLIEVHEPIIFQIVSVHTVRIPKFPELSIRYLKRQLKLIAKNDVLSASRLNQQYLRRLMRMMEELDSLEVRITALGDPVADRSRRKPKAKFSAST